MDKETNLVGRNAALQKKQEREQITREWKEDRERTKEEREESKQLRKEAGGGQAAQEGSTGGTQAVA